MSAKLTPGRAIAKQRASLKAKVARLLKRYDQPSVTDADIKTVLGEVAAFLATAPERYNAKPGGLGR
jgi:hypothetical protein